MKNTLRIFVLGALHLCVTGCSILITNPAHNSTVSSLPLTLRTEVQGSVAVPDVVLLDGNDLKHYNGGNYQIDSGARIACVVPGSHSLFVGAAAAASTRVTDQSSFTVAAGACPTCPACPAGDFLHPLNCQCCANGQCDDSVFTNFGLALYGTAACSTQQQQDYDCLNQNQQSICGAGTNSTCTAFPSSNPTQAIGVRFVAVRDGTLSHIRLPLSHRGGPNSYRLLIMEDSNGQPGAVVEDLPLTNVRAWAFPTRGPLHVLSSARPLLRAGQNYWLVVSPGASLTLGSWNFSGADTPAAGSSNYLVNTVIAANGLPDPAQWSPAGGPLRPAFEIDVR